MLLGQAGTGPGISCNFLFTSHNFYSPAKILISLIWLYLRTQTRREGLKFRNFTAYSISVMM